jgi:hypothetical protein
MGIGNITVQSDHQCAAFTTVTELIVRTIRSIPVVAAARRSIREYDWNVKKS